MFAPAARLLGRAASRAVAHQHQRSAVRGLGAHVGSVASISGTCAVSTTSTASRLQGSGAAWRQMAIRLTLSGALGEADEDL
jgi:hypothetical protein